jgi:hypothetical protein
MTNEEIVPQGEDPSTKIYYPAELRKMGFVHYEDTIEAVEYKSIWRHEDGRSYKCTHASNSRMDRHGRDIYDERIAKKR